MWVNIDQYWSLNLLITDQYVTFSSDFRPRPHLNVKCSLQCPVRTDLLVYAAVKVHAIKLSAGVVFRQGNKVKKGPQPVCVRLRCVYIDHRRRVNVGSLSNDNRCVVNCTFGTPKTQYTEHWCQMYQPTSVKFCSATSQISVPGSPHIGTENRHVRKRIYELLLFLQSLLNFIIETLDKTVAYVSGDWPISTHADLRPHAAPYSTNSASLAWRLQWVFIP